MTTEPDNLNATPPDERQPGIAHDYGCTFDPCRCREPVTLYLTGPHYAKVERCEHGNIDPHEYRHDWYDTLQCPGSPTLANHED